MNRCIFLQKFDCGRLEILRLERQHVERVVSFAITFFLGRSPFSLEEMMSSRYWLIHSSQDHCSALHRTSWQAGFIQIVVVSFPAGIPSSTVHVVSSFFFNGIKHNCSPIKGGTKCSLNFLSYTFTFRGLQAARLY